jgi:shikimate kinase
LAIIPADMLGLVHGEFWTVYRRLDPAGQGKSVFCATMSGAPLPLPRTVALVGLMGAGKSSIGRRLALRLKVPFVDADSEIETAADATIEEIFERHGEAAFREGERRVIARLLEGPVHVLATGGGAFMDPVTRSLLRERAISVWLRADVDLLLSRVMRRNNRPLLKAGEPRVVLERLVAERHPIYAQADIIVDTVEGPPETTLEHVLAALGSHLGVAAVAP